MELSTTHVLPGFRPHATLGIVAGEAIVTTDVIRDTFANLKNLFGGRVGAYERCFRKAREDAMEALIKHARELGAQGVIGISLDYETISHDKGGFLIVVATGTAVLATAIRETSLPFNERPI